MTRRPAILALILTILCACSSGSIYSGFRDIPSEGWRYGDVLTFDTQLADSSATGTLTVSLRHTNEYLYSNIYLEIAVADSLHSFVDTLEITLADPFGRWHGRGIGTDFQITDTVARSITLHRPALISVRHIMRDDILRDIEHVGVSFVQQ